MVLSEKLDNYIGGQVEIRNPEEKSLYRGQIKEIFITRDRLYFWFDWMAKGEDTPKRWVKDDTRNYALNLKLYDISDEDDGTTTLDSPLIGETLILFPKDGDKLEKTQILEERV